MDKSREEFESWAEEAGALPWGYLKRQRNPSGGYSIQIYTYMWQAWQASRKALVVALPQGTGWNSDLYNSGRNAGLQQAANAIRAAGITVKGEGDDLISTPQHILNEKWKRHFGGEGDE